MSNYKSIHKSCILPASKREFYYIGNEYNFIELTCRENEKNLIWNDFMCYWEYESTRKFARWMDKHDELIISKCKAYFKNVADLTTDYNALPF